MKNEYKEYQRKLQKRSSKQRSGIYLPHIYEDKQLTYWSDMCYWLNGTRYSITYIHLRCEYKDKCHEIVWNEMYPLRPKSDMLSKPCRTKKLGKSRKKTILFSMEETNKEAVDAWHKALWKREEDFLATSDVVVKPYVKVEWWDKSKHIHICLPYEIQTEEQAVFVTEMIMEHYKLSSLYEWVSKMSAIIYNRDNWDKEHKEST